MTKTLIFTIAALIGIFVTFGFQDTLAIPDVDDKVLVASKAKAIPDWVDQSFRWYGQGQITQSELLNSMKYLLDNSIMHLSEKAAKEVNDLRAENKKLHHEVSQYRESDLDFTARSIDKPTDAPYVPGGSVVSAAAGMNGVHIKDQSGKIHGFILTPTDVDVNALVQSVLRESYMETSKDLEFYAEKVKRFNDQKEAIRYHINEMRDFQVGMHQGTMQTPKTDFGSMMKSGVSHTQMTPSQTKVLVMGMVSDGHNYAKKKIGQLVADGENDPKVWGNVFSDIRMHTMQYQGYNELKMGDTTGSADSTIDDLQGIVVLCNTALDSEIQSLQVQVDLMKELSDLHRGDKTPTSDYSTRATADLNEDVDGVWWGEKLGRIDKKIRSLQTAVSVCEDKNNQWETQIKNLEEELSSVGDDAQLANIDLQNSLQKQQQALQSMSNVSKMLHDTAMAIIRKIG